MTVSAVGPPNHVHFCASTETVDMVDT